MGILITGVVLWSLLHFLPAADVSLRKNVITKIGENPYKGIFALLMALSIYLIISGGKFRMKAGQLIAATSAYAARFPVGHACCVLAQSR